jgi:hypothetical protein
MKEKKLNIIPYTPFTDKGTLNIGKEIYYNKIFFKDFNAVVLESLEPTLTAGSKTTEEIIDSHINKYDKVWQELA